MGTAKQRQANVLEIIKSQHDEAEMLITKLEEEDLDAADKLMAFHELADKLAAHASMEEQLFYPAIRAKQTEELLLEAVEEHLAMKRVLADMVETDVEDPRFDAKLSLLKEQVEHHAREEEERKLFPKLRPMFSEEELEALGAECLALFERLRTMQPHKMLRQETRAPASI